MQHLTDESIAAALDLHGRDEAGHAARAHVAICAECRVMLESARADERESARLLSFLDHAVPPVDVRQLLDRSSSHRRLRSGSRKLLRIGGIGQVPWWIGAMVAGVTVAAAAIVPYASLRRLVTHHTASARQLRRVVATSPAAGSDALQASRGIAIIPNGSAEVVFRSLQGKGMVRVTPGNGAELRVEADGDGPTYAVSQNSVVVNNNASDSISYRVVLPAAARGTVRILIAGTAAYTRGALRERAGEAIAHTGDVVLLLQAHAR